MRPSLSVMIAAAGLWSMAVDNSATARSLLSLLALLMAKWSEPAARAAIPSGMSQNA
ncbi:MAG: hypothetical protein ACD_75C02053G0002 [uncultured bacterium]|nr:MAG: hypothetical protein ACD_75C02053G0002 [uncultured bacterium]